MIDHSQCDHPRTSGARAKCRRASAGDDTPKKSRATPKDVDLSGGSGNPTSQTPAWAADECHICGVERIEFAGTDAYINMQVLVGEKCAWRVKRSDDFRAFVRR